MSNSHLSSTSFASLGLNSKLLANVQATGFEYCTHIQAKTLPHSITGQDIAGQAQTGTGKTAAFLIAIFEHLLRNTAAKSGCRALVIAPTRELAIQIHQDAIALANNLPLTLALAYGGANYKKQLQQVSANPDIVIGTTGRLIDFYKKKALNLKNCQALVLDEADRMFDLGFIADVRFLLRRCPAPQQRLTLLFSATLSHKVQELAYEHMDNPKFIKVAKKSIVTTQIEQYLYQPGNDEKIRLLIGLIRRSKPSRALVFANTKSTAEFVHACLEQENIKSALLSGDVPQQRRGRIVKEFAAGKYNVVVATDVASRGLHIDDISHVFNYDLPQMAEDYVHRIGRTARAGTSGMAISFACEETAFNLMDIEDYIKQAIPKKNISEQLLDNFDPAPIVNKLKQKRQRQRNQRRHSRRRK